MIIRNVELETVCGVTSKLPENILPEFAFAGKSNVGKSSLINALMNRKALARTSAQPGKTQTINFYNINKELYYVDLPGYGYAKVSQTEKEKWGKMIENYLHKSKMLKCVFLLVDIRHEPSANDRTMYEWVVYNGFRPVIIATKLDKINRSQIQKQVKLIRNGLGMEKNDVIIPFSAASKQGEGRDLGADREDGRRRRKRTGRRLWGKRTGLIREKNGGAHIAMTWAPPEPLYVAFLFYGLLVCIHHCQSKGDDGSGDGDQKKKISTDPPDPSGQIRPLSFHGLLLF